MTLDELRRQRGDLLAAAAVNGITSVRVFGSVARGDADDDSDLDLLVDVLPGYGRFAMGAFAFAVQDLLGVFTQVVTVAGLTNRIRDRVMGEAVQKQYNCEDRPRADPRRARRRRPD